MTTHLPAAGSREPSTAETHYIAALRRALDALHEASALASAFDPHGAQNRVEAKRALRRELARLQDAKGTAWVQP
jgi:hypothetical protein